MWSMDDWSRAEQYIVIIWPMMQNDMFRRFVV